MCKNDIRILIGGDFCPKGLPQDALLQGSVTEADIFGPIQALVRDSDFSIINLECPLSDRGAPIVKTGPLLRADPRMVSLLTYMGVSAVSLANNHILDFGSDALIDTLSICHENGIETVGAGANLEQARKVLIVEIRDRRVAFINMAEQEFSSATREHSGANPFDLIDLCSAIQNLKKTIDHLVVIVHGGLERTHIPSPQSVKVLRFVAEQGVSAVIRHHSHYIQSYEVWKGVPIFYGLGNILSDSARNDADWNTGLLVQLAFPMRGPSISTLYPVCQNGSGKGMVSFPDETMKKSILIKINEYNRWLSNDKLLGQEWQRVLEEREADYFGLMFLPKTMLGLLRRLKLLSRIRPSLWRRNVFLNLARCDAHREVCIDLLSRMKHKW